MPFTSYTFNPGLSDTVYLPSNGSVNFFESSLKTGLTGGSTAIESCYGKYGLRWKWSTFESSPSAIHALSSQQLIYPSTWSSMQCTLSAGTVIADNPGPYPKKWVQERPLSADLFNPSFVECQGSPITWTLSSTNWSIRQVIPLSVSDTFNFELRLSGFGEDVYTASRHQNSNFTLNAKLSVTCLDLFSVPITSSITEISETQNFTVIPPPELKLYTPFRFALTGANVQFQNLFTNINEISALQIDFDDGKTLFLTGQNIRNDYFTTSYEILGFKTIKVTAFTKNYTESSYTVEYPDLIQIIDNYDIISPSEYRTSIDPINLPYPKQPFIGSNEWAVEDNINDCFKQFYKNLEYLDSRSKIYNKTYSDFFGYLGPLPTVIGGVYQNPTWTWEDADCLNTSLNYSVTWRTVLSSDIALDNGEFVPYGKWEDHECPVITLSPDCTERSSLTGLDCLKWSWKARKSNNVSDVFEFVTWNDVKSDGKNVKQWKANVCPTEDFIVCDEGVWNVNIPYINDFYNNFGSTSVQTRCIYYGIASRNNKIYTAQKTQIKLLSSDYDAFYYAHRKTLDGLRDFSSLESIRLDSSNKIFALDSILSQVAVYKYDPAARGDDWTLLVNWGGIGAGSYKFSNPQDLHVDQLDNVWIADTGNNCVKHYSNTGTWLKTIRDDVFSQDKVVSICVDSQKQLHVLTNREIRVYSYEGQFIFAYDYSSRISENKPKRINSSFNREIIYFATDKQVLKFFRNGVFCGYIIEKKDNVYNIQDIYHDEFRHLLVATNDKILKYSDLMSQTLTKGKLPGAYWSLNDLLIHKEEYVQNWVYSKSFQRLWDNIEMFRNSLFFDKQGCKSYVGPLYLKNEMILGQNEIVTSTSINRVLKYLWENFSTLLNYFDPNCKD